MPSRAYRFSLPTVFALVALACTHPGSGFLEVPPQIAPANGSVFLPGGSFRMGTDSAELLALQKKFPKLPAKLFALETPAHDVVLAPFGIDRAEITGAHRGCDGASDAHEEERAAGDCLPGNVGGKVGAQREDAGEGRSG